MGLKILSYPHRPITTHFCKGFTGLGKPRVLALWPPADLVYDNQRPQRGSGVKHSDLLIKAEGCTTKKVTWVSAPCKSNQSNTVASPSHHNQRQKKGEGTRGPGASQETLWDVGQPTDDASLLYAHKRINLGNKN